MSEEYEVLLEAWENVLDELELGYEGIISSEGLKSLIFDTYHCFKEKIGDSETIPRSYLMIHHLIIDSIIYFEDFHMDNVSDEESEIYACALKGLCYVLEKGSDIKSGKYTLPMGKGRYNPLGSDTPDADMTTYESFEKSFAAAVEMIREGSCTE